MKTLIAAVLLLPSLVAADEAPSVVMAAIPPGLRGYTVPVPPALSAGVRAGDRVDMFHVVDSPKGAYTGFPTSNVLVLAVQPAALTLALSPDEVVYAAAGRSVGTPFVTLRSPGDVEMVSHEFTRLDHILEHPYRRGPLTRLHIEHGRHWAFAMDRKLP